MTTSTFLLGEERDTDLIRRTTVVFDRDFIISAGKHSKLGDKTRRLIKRY